MAASAGASPKANPTATMRQAKPRRSSSLGMCPARKRRSSLPSICPSPASARSQALPSCFSLCGAAQGRGDTQPGHLADDASPHRERSIACFLGLLSSRSPCYSSLRCGLVSLMRVPLGAAGGGILPVLACSAQVKVVESDAGGLVARVAVEDTHPLGDRAIC